MAPLYIENKKPPDGWVFGAGSQNRTDDTRLFRPLLYH